MSHTSPNIVTCLDMLSTHTDEEVAEHCACSLATVRRYRRDLGISRGKGGRPRGGSLDQFSEYIGTQATDAEIAAIAGCSKANVGRWRKLRGIAARPRPEKAAP